MKIQVASFKDYNTRFYFLFLKLMAYEVKNCILYSRQNGTATILFLDNNFK